MFTIHLHRSTPRNGGLLPRGLLAGLLLWLAGATALSAQSASQSASQSPPTSAENGARSAPATDLRGVVRLVEDGDDETDREFRSALVWFEPAGEVDLEVPEEPFEMVTVRKDFLPKVLAVPVGASVSFPNQDPILHNVFSRSQAHRFDLGFYRGGDSRSTTFLRPGVVRVFCNVHHSMVAYIAVLDTPHHTRLDRDGAFVLDDVPAGPGRLTVWHERAEPREMEIELPLGSALRIDLQITKPKVPRHRNKFGKPYSRKRRGRAY